MAGFFMLGGQNLKKTILTISLGILLILSIPTLIQSPVISHYNNISSSVFSAEVWSDNFNDEDISDWSVWGWNTTDAEKFVGNYTLTNGALRTQGENTTRFDHACQITANATWSFDVDCVNTSESHFSIAFFAGIPTNETLNMPYEYGILVVTGVFGAFDTEFVLYRRNAGSLTLSNIIGRYNLETVTGWHHIDVTRDEVGHFYAYFNGTLGISGSDGFYDNAEYFSFYARGGPAIDNLVVTDEFYDPLPPVVSYPGDMEILENASFVAHLNATDFSGISTWWLNDTEHFSIDSDGVITTTTTLTPGTYGIQVSVNDTLNNIMTIEFTLTVLQITTTTDTGTETGTVTGTDTDTGTVTTDTDNGIDPLTIVLIAGGGIIIILVLVIVVKSRKS